MKSAHKGTLPTASGSYMKVRLEAFLLGLVAFMLSFPAKLSSLHTSMFMGRRWATSRNCIDDKIQHV